MNQNIHSTLHHVRETSPTSESSSPPDGRENQHEGKGINNRNHWRTYQKAVYKHREWMIGNFPGYFSLPPHEKFHQQCLSCPLLNHIRCQMPLIVLPLRIHLIRSEELGCSNDLNQESIQKIVFAMNKYWEQAAIKFQLSCVDNISNGVVERRIDELISEEVRLRSRHFIEHGLTRGDDGKMKNKDQRQSLFLNILLQPFNYQEDSRTYDLYFFDMIGMGSQGVCICRQTHTLIMGERSTKGYHFPTKRPHQCLAKTMAHELGHALGLGHPAHLKFRDGKDQCEIRGKRKNLMCGGADRKGGGGEYLEPWQICSAREEANEFVQKCR